MLNFSHVIGFLRRDDLESLLRHLRKLEKTIPTLHRLHCSGLCVGDTPCRGPRTPLSHTDVEISFDIIFRGRNVQFTVFELCNHILYELTRQSGGLRCFDHFMKMLGLLSDDFHLDMARVVQMALEDTKDPIRSERRVFNKRLLRHLLPTLEAYLEESNPLAPSISREFRTDVSYGLGYVGDAALILHLWTSLSPVMVLNGAITARNVGVVMMCIARGAIVRGEHMHSACFQLREACSYDEGDVPMCIEVLDTLWTSRGKKWNWNIHFAYAFRYKKPLVPFVEWGVQRDCPQHLLETVQSSSSWNDVYREILG